MGKIKAICISKKRGTPKRNVSIVKVITDYGIEGDAHSGKWHRQISLLSNEKIEDFRKLGANVEYGAFGENIVVEGFDFSKYSIGTRFQVNDIVLEITQIGKECHDHCQIYELIGDCIMPREGVFAKVINGGEMRTGDEMHLISDERAFKVAVLTLSDKCSKYEREDKSGAIISSMVEEMGYRIIDKVIIPDEREQIEKELIRLSDEKQADLILTTGGTGLSVRDVTPEATMAVATRNVPGIAEAIRAYSMQITKRAMLSRCASVIRNNTLIINLPGSPKAVSECIEYIRSELDHGLRILKGLDFECARD